MGRIGQDEAADVELSQDEVKWWQGTTVDQKRVTEVGKLREITQ